jgi:D-Tyr-tRNAtyr deacylase
MQGQTVTHRWERGDKVMSEVKFEVGSARWRVFSSKRLDPSWTGEWKVSVIDTNGSTLSASTFTYAAADAAVDKAPAPAAAPAQ